jgi:hypothetical protein
MTDYPTFDIEARDRIRTGLLNYKRAHGIGTPKMARRISEVNINHPTVAHRTLARFLARQHDPHDHFIAWCDKFLRGLPAAPDPSWELAKGLMSFYGIEEMNGFAGDYTLFTNGNDDRPQATLSVTQDAGFCRVSQKDIGHNRFFDGVSVATQNTNIVALKNRMTRVPRLYKITRMDGLALHTSDNGRVHTYPIRLVRV